MAVEMDVGGVGCQSSALDRSMQFYRQRQKSFADQYHGKFVVIQDDRVLGFFDDEFEAYQTARSRYPLGTFLLRRCLAPGEESELRFHSPVT